MTKERVTVYGLPVVPGRRVPLGRVDPALARELREKLPEHPAVEALATNPLLCAMICSLHWHRRGFLPQGQNSLCE